ncbi:MAG: DNA repair protein RecN [Dehalococcoidales bacterium]
MLSELSVKNFGIIEEICWKPSKGLNVITGETGAGKSLVVDAVEALLSGQVQEDDIRIDSEDARIEGIFHITGASVLDRLLELLSEKGIQLEEDTLIIACSFRRQSRTIPRINRQAVPMALLKDIGTSVVDIHSQTGHISLLDREKHLDFLDDYAHNRELRRNFSAMVSELHQAEREIQALSRTEQDLTRQTELLKFQIEEIRQAELGEKEDEELETELAILASAEKLKAASYDIYTILHGDESTLASSSALDRLNEALPLLRKIAETDPSVQTRLERFENAANELSELANEVRSYGDNLDYDPHRLEEVQDRLELIRNLKRKYGASINAISDFLAGAEKELEGLTYSGDRRRQLAEKVGQLTEEMGALAHQLSQARIRAAEKLTSAMKKELADLDMEKVDFKVSISQQPAGEGIPFPDGQRYQFSPSGADRVEFMTSTNPGEPLKPLARIASAGEISRFMLSLKCALAESDTTPLLIFDEIDIGIGGRSGEIIGKKLWTLSRNHQVICVTHLPQIAAFADSHFSVSKESAGNRTISKITELQGEARLNELAVMVGGPGFTSNSLNTARELLQKADSLKSSLSGIAE